MRITQLRNATIVLHIGNRHILVDPMLAPRGALPPLRLLDGKRERNPTVPLPEVAGAVLQQVTHCLITHCQKGHFDHLDTFGKKWLRDTQTPVICTPHDAAYLRQRGLNVQPLGDDHAHGVPLWEGNVQTVHCTHGEGVVGRFMEHGVGYYITQPGEPSLYLLGDTILTPAVAGFVQQHQPDYCVAPAGGARFDVGGDIIMGVDDVLELTRLAQGTVIANHLQAISHCPVTREDLLAAARATGVAQRLWVPQDGETMACDVRDGVAA
ncbi:MBL fold metallo-hydrolase [Acidovorax sp.]|uniref:MBL fold metallo-hydrolase n=1 Tax=Acidovorax sp. TaxID=1872122 RepID=UPI002ACE0E70|nr:MBL fold metallo-hydrolase [Acidovorax sp.]MDZ7862251.1 MBL fold metallo-hydrolase [Acidovorax sp.]